MYSRMGANLGGSRKSPIFRISIFDFIVLERNKMKDEIQ
jgi:hypothetical protein